MSKDAAITFLKQVAESAEMQQKVVAFAKEQGYEFSVGELTDAELGGVAGGLIDEMRVASAFIDEQRVAPTFINEQRGGSLGASKLGGSALGG